MHSRPLLYTVDLPSTNTRLTVQSRDTPPSPLALSLFSLPLPPSLPPFLSRVVDVDVNVVVVIVVHVDVHVFCVFFLIVFFLGGLVLLLICYVAFVVVVAVVVVVVVFI